MNKQELRQGKENEQNRFVAFGVLSALQKRQTKPVQPLLSRLFQKKRGIDDLSHNFGLTYTVVHPRDIFKTSILSNAANVMLIHNHPSGELEPSQEDLDMTERMVSAGRVLGIDVVDHLIIGSKDMSYTSLRERGVMEFPEKGWKELERAADRQPEHTL